MKRMAEQELINWKNSSRRKPLIIRGARQVGKTWLAENVLASQFDSFVKIDLEKRRDLHVHFAGNLDCRLILNYMELATRRIIPGETLLFFDEIQACPRAITALRYFYEEMPELHVVAAGSLLEFAFGEISVPVGRVQYLHLYPLTLYEYLLAVGREPMAEYSVTPPRPVHLFRRWYLRNCAIIFIFEPFGTVDSCFYRNDELQTRWIPASAGKTSSKGYGFLLPQE